MRGPRRTAESKASLAQLERYLWRTWKEPLEAVLGSRRGQHWTESAESLLHRWKIKSAEKYAVYPKSTAWSAWIRPIAFLWSSKRLFLFRFILSKACRVCSYSYIFITEFRRDENGSLDAQITSGGLGGNILSKRLEGLLTLKMGVFDNRRGKKRLSTFFQSRRRQVF